MDKETNPQIDALLGEAIKLMVESGVPTSLIGQFAQRYPAILATHLPPPPPPAPAEVPADLKEIVKQAVREVIAGASTDLSTGQNAQRRSRGAKKVPVTVALSTGRTGVRVRADLYEKLVALGHQSSANKLVKTFAESAPPGHDNRSAWVDEQLAQYLVLTEVEVRQSSH